jgi:hypothetical protein
MQDSEVRQLDRGNRVQEFASAHASLFPAHSHAAEVVANHSNAVAEVKHQAVRQDAAALDRQESTAQKDAAIKSLVELMRPVNQTARSMDKQQPGFADQFRMPRYSDQAILNRAGAFIAEAAPVAVEFTKRGLPESFVADMQSAVERVVAAEARQSVALANQTEATAALRLALKKEQDAMRELNAIMRNQLRNDPALLAAWESASRIESAPKKKTPTTKPTA